MFGYSLIRWFFSSLLQWGIEECFFHCGKAFIRSKLWQPESWGNPYKVSFGKMFAERKGLGESVSDQIDTAIQADYENNL